MKEDKYMFTLLIILISVIAIAELAHRRNITKEIN
jgi:hypothetical protein